MRGRYVLYYDNMADYIAKNSVFHEKNEACGFDCYLVREKVEQGILQLLHVGLRIS